MVSLVTLRLSSFQWGETHISHLHPSLAFLQTSFSWWSADLCLSFHWLAPGDSQTESCELSGLRLCCACGASWCDRFYELPPNVRVKWKPRVCILAWNQLTVRVKTHAKQGVPFPGVLCHHLNQGASWSGWHKKRNTACTATQKRLSSSKTGCLTGFCDSRATALSYSNFREKIQWA